MFDSYKIQDGSVWITLAFSSKIRKNRICHIKNITERKTVLGGQRKTMHEIILRNKMKFPVRCVPDDRYMLLIDSLNREFNITIISENP